MNTGPGSDGSLDRILINSSPTLILVFRPDGSMGGILVLGLIILDLDLDSTFLCSP